MTRTAFRQLMGAILERAIDDLPVIVDHQLPNGHVDQANLRGHGISFEEARSAYWIIHDPIFEKIWDGCVVPELQCHQGEADDRLPQGTEAAARMRKRFPKKGC